MMAIKASPVGEPYRQTASTNTHGRGVMDLPGVIFILIGGGGGSRWVPLFADAPTAIQRLILRALILICGQEHRQCEEGKVCGTNFMSQIKHNIKIIFFLMLLR